MINFKVGILGAGNIAEAVADTLNKLDAFEPYAIASRDIEKAKAFAEKYNIEKSYGSYEELANDPEVELIYIATPHSHHAEQAKMCINSGKPVLVEKAFSYNGESAKEVLDLANEKKVFCGEAIWTRYMPSYLYIKDRIKNGAIGEVQNIVCSLGYDVKAKERIVNPALAGGALLDLGVYPLNLIYMVYGIDPAQMATTCARLSSGVDAQFVLQMSFPTGQVATVFSTILYKADNNAIIYGNKGYMEIDNINNPEEIRIYNGDGKLVDGTKVTGSQKNGNPFTGYEYEFIAARNAIILGKTEPEQMPHSETLRIMNLMDGIRNIWKIKYPME